MGSSGEVPDFVTSVRMGAWLHLLTDVGFEMEAPDRLFHYTSPTGLLGIINSSRPYASHVRSMNDASELDYADRLLYAALERRLKYSRGGDERVLLQNILNALAIYATAPFAFCLSEEGDLVSQWREYTNGGAGFAIGFDLRRIEHQFSKRRLMLVRVMYSERAQKRLIRDIIERGCAKLRDLDRDNYTPEDAGQTLGMALSLYRLMFKNPMFKDEREWRLIHVKPPFSSNQVKFRPSSSGITPYVDVNLSAGRKRLPPIAELIVGPALDYGSSIEPIAWALTARGFQVGDIALKASQAPLRKVR